ncbi:MAG: hypothetical protein AAGI68_09230 [Planctomycetota bacterium]
MSDLKPLVVSAPFGNYLHPAGATATMGTFTVMRRGGIAARVWRVIKTVRYYRGAGAWVNRIGLRNPGIGWVEKKVAAGKLDVSDKLISVHGFDGGQWRELVERAAALRPLGVELNMSCPNVGEVVDWQEVFESAAEVFAGGGVGVVVKLPPVRYQAMAEAALGAGLRGFHACNTLPVPGGGLSGRPLRPLVEGCLRWLNDRPERGEMTVIAGGGVGKSADVRAYRALGAESVALGTKLMHPRYLFGYGGIAEIVAAAWEEMEDETVI